MVVCKLYLKMYFSYMKFEGRIHVACVFKDWATPRHRVQPCCQDRVLYHMEIRTVYARRMFKEELRVWHGSVHLGVRHHCVLQQIRERADRLRPTRLCFSQCTQCTRDYNLGAYNLTQTILVFVQYIDLCSRRDIKDPLSLSRQMGKQEGGGWGGHQ